MTKKIYVFSLLIIMMFLLFGCTSIDGNINLNSDDFNEPIYLNYQIVKSFRRSSGILYENPEPIVANNLTSMLSYEDYRNVYPLDNSYDETYFTTHGLILYRGSDQYNSCYHEILSLVYYNNNIHLHALHYITTDYYIPIVPEWHIYYLIEYQKPEKIDDVVLIFTQKQQEHFYHLDQEDNIKDLKNRLMQNDYAEANIIIGFDIASNHNISKEEFLLTKIDEYDLDELLGEISMTSELLLPDLDISYKLYINYDLLSINDVDKVISLLDHTDIVYACVRIKT